uniref:AAR2 C-terminal domain-containing protein n=1 Tax=Panagrolaimus davidi TaxID=227884 RepID=A0A914QNT4_9BILA
MLSFTEESKYRPGIDNSDRLDLLAKSLGNNYNEVLAEFQYAFVVFLIGQVYDGYDQWKRLIHLFSSCRAALQCPDDFFIDVLSKDNFLSTTLAWFFANVEDAPEILSPELRAKTAKVKAFFEKKFNRSFDLPSD